MSKYIYIISIITHNGTILSQQYDKLSQQQKDLNFLKKKYIGEDKDFYIELKGLICNIQDVMAITWEKIDRKELEKQMEEIKNNEQ